MRNIVQKNILSSSDLIGGSHITLKDPSGKPKDDNKGDEAGNVFFYILIAVALFAALSYAVSRNNTGSTDIFTEEQAKLAAQEIIEYGNTVANAVQKLRLRGVAETDLGFDNDTYFRVNGVLLNPIGQNSNCTSDDCQVFKADGGNINPVLFDNLGVDDSGFSSTFGKSGHAIFRTINVDGIGTVNNEISMELLDIPKQICYQINQLTGNLFADSSPSESYEPLNYTGTFSNSTNTIGDGSNLNAKTAFCIDNGNTGHFIQILLAR